MWLSLVEHLVWDQDVAGSNPVIPTITKGTKLLPYSESCTLPYLFKTNSHSIIFNAIDGLERSESGLIGDWLRLAKFKELVGKC